MFWQKTSAEKHRHTLSAADINDDDGNSFSRKHTFADMHWVRHPALNVHATTNYALNVPRDTVSTLRVCLSLANVHAYACTCSSAQLFITSRDHAM